MANTRLSIPGKSIDVTNEVFDQITTSVTFKMIIENFSSEELHPHECLPRAGRVLTPPRVVQPQTREGLVGQKTPHTATGCVGTISWTIGNTGKMLVVMYSVPFDHNLHSNWCAVGIFPTSNTSNFFKTMYKGPETSFKRKEFWKDLASVLYEGTHYKVTAKMDNSHKPEIEVTRYNDI